MEDEDLKVNINPVLLSDYEQAKGAFSSARSNFQTAQKTLDLQSAQLRYTRIIAPANGIVTAVNSVNRCWEINERLRFPGSLRNGSDSHCRLYRTVPPHNPY